MKPVRYVMLCRACKREVFVQATARRQTGRLVTRFRCPKHGVVRDTQVMQGWLGGEDA